MDSNQIALLEEEYLRRARADEAAGFALNASTWRLAAALLTTGHVSPSGIEARVCSDIAARQRIGIAKYGCTVEASKDDMLRHAYEEALDLAVYLKAEIERRISHENQ